MQNLKSEQKPRGSCGGRFIMSQSLLMHTSGVLFVGLKNFLNEKEELLQ